LSLYPLIASIHGGSRDVIEDGINLFLADHDDIGQLADATLQTLTAHEEAWRRMGREARQSVLKGYTRNQIPHRILDIYEGV
jgi:glycosyltransferase involved in cell wall biosynthesis